MSRMIRFHQFGDASVLRLEDVPTPKPGPGEVLIRTQALGVNWRDVLWRQNLAPSKARLPAGIGQEMAGVVTAVGAGVDDIAKGAFCAVSARWRIELQLRTASLVHAHMRNWASQCRIALRPNLEGLQHVFASSIECVRAQIRLRLRRCGCLHQSHAQALFC